MFAISRMYAMRKENVNLSGPQFEPERRMRHSDTQPDNDDNDDAIASIRLSNFFAAGLAVHHS
jgi:hypothetical protein